MKMVDGSEPKVSEIIHLFGQLSRIMIRFSEDFIMSYIWKDYHPVTMSFIESWLDTEAVNMTGIDDGWRAFHEYWITDGGLNPGVDYWCKVVYDAGIPFAIIAFSLSDKTVHIMELLVKPEMRGKGLGSSLICELLSDGERIMGRRIEKASAVIYPNNHASQKAFEHAGFTFDYANGDGDAWVYSYVPQKESAGETASRKAANRKTD